MPNLEEVARGNIDALKESFENQKNLEQNVKEQKTEQETIVKLPAVKSQRKRGKTKAKKEEQEKKKETPAVVEPPPQKQEPPKPMRSERPPRRAIMLPVWLLKYLGEARKRLKEIWCIMTHPAPHFSDAIAIWLFQKFGNQNVSIQLTERRQFSKSALEYLDDGIIQVGINGGIDEHAGPEHERVEEECEATIMAKLLNRERDPSLYVVLQAALANDTEGQGVSSGEGGTVRTINIAVTDISEALKRRHRLMPGRDLEHLAWVWKELDLIYQDQLAIVSDAIKEEFKKKDEDAFSLPYHPGAASGDPDRGH